MAKYERLTTNYEGRGGKKSISLLGDNGTGGAFCSKNAPLKI